MKAYILCYAVICVILTSNLYLRKYKLNTFYFFNWKFLLIMSYARFKRYRSYENILMEGTVSQNSYLGPSFHFLQIIVLDFIK